MSVRKYELFMILDPAQGEDLHKVTLTKLEEVIVRFGGTVAERDVWGKRRLAYSLNRRREGYYVVQYFECEAVSECLREVEMFCKFSEEILRHIVTVAVVGKSKGNPALAAQVMERQQQPVGPPSRGPRSYGDRGGAPAPSAAPAAVIEASEDAAAEAAPETTE